MLCDHEPELGAVLSMNYKEKTVTAFLYFPIYGEETENQSGEKSKPIIGYEVMDTKGTRYNCRESNDPFVYNLLHLLSAPSWLTNKEECDAWGVYADFMEDTAETPKRKVKVMRDDKEVEEETAYTGKKIKVKQKVFVGYDDKDEAKYEEQEVEQDEVWARDITEEIAWMRAMQYKEKYEERTKFFDKECKWEVT